MKNKYVFMMYLFYCKSNCNITTQMMSAFLYFIKKMKSSKISDTMTIII